ncbi:excalibur calcium-binding domain-containing protein [Sphingomonas populi]|uniref:Excalibur calcium-binding domain-containing protein n=2 Tax=Sphingomonas populi TaxID=2484750 RepID=A0A4Q6XTL4_9SPHN|nr:excalibur calcium-binding domain-containing protein [Sphingomonas populi]
MRSRYIPMLSTLLAAAALGLIFGAATSPLGRSALSGKTNQLAILIGWERHREPQAGDVWGGCNDARSSGTFPIYRGEPGYREDMDGDGDGIACEPY